MSNQDEFFTPEEVDRQIDQVSRLKEGEQADAEVLAYLRSLYGIDSRQEQEMLDRIWNRIAGAAPPLRHNLQQRQEAIAIQHQPAQFGNPALHKRRNTLIQRLGMLAAAVFLVALVGSMALVFYTIRHNGGPANGHPKPTAIVTTVPSTPTPTTRPVPFKVTSVDMSITPGSIAGIACGTNVTVTYTATIHVTPNGPGGTVQFSYTVNNGRGQTMANVTFAPGEISKTYSFTWSGALPVDHTYPQSGGIHITSPNQLISPLVAPGGTCVSAAAFVVTRIDMAVSPTTIAGLSCGTNLTVTYTATIHVAPGSNGGTVQFLYSVNNGRGSSQGSLVFAPGVTTMTYSFTWSGALPLDHTYPQPGGIQVTSPNQLLSPMVGPGGTCK